MAEEFHNRIIDSNKIPGLGVSLNTKFYIAASGDFVIEPTDISRTTSAGDDAYFPIMVYI
ncbi:MAG: hypothetical protein LBU32_05290 [Clostridiales bacterium]|nr:hypothetical protein [Clostridiales bacterium]